MRSKRKCAVTMEYFGAIARDPNVMSVVILDKSETNLLWGLRDGNGGTSVEGKRLLSQEKSKPENEKLRKTVDTLINRGVLDNNLNLDARLLKPMDPAVDNTLSSPIRIYDEVTRRCNLSCAHCYASSSSDYRASGRGQELTVEQRLEILRKLHEAGVTEYRATGGEPTILKGFFDIAKQAREYGMNVMVNTNGILSKDTISKVIESGIDELIISVDGLEESHDKRRGRGSFAKTLSSINTLIEYNKSSSDKVRLTINQTVGKENVHDAESLVMMAASLGLNVNFMPLRPYGRALNSDMMDAREFMEFTRKVNDLRGIKEVADSGIDIYHKNCDLFGNYTSYKSQPRPFDKSSCGASATGLGINYDGIVNACGFLAQLPEFQGPNLLQASVQDAWMHPNIVGFRHVVKKHCEPCGYYQKNCAGTCKAMALAEHDKLDEMDRYCFKHLMEVSKDGFKHDNQLYNIKY